MILAVRQSNLLHQSILDKFAAFVIEIHLHVLVCDKLLLNGQDLGDNGSEQERSTNNERLPRFAYFLLQLSWR